MKDFLRKAHAILVCVFTHPIRESCHISHSGEILCYRS